MQTAQAGLHLAVRRADVSTVLLITRKYPPSVGGMELYAERLFEQMQNEGSAVKVSLGKSQLHLVWFIPWSIIAGAVHCWRSRVTHVHVGDALLAPVGLILDRLFSIQLSVTTYGLDVVYPRRSYQWMVRACLPRYPIIVCISEATRQACIGRGVDPRSCSVIPCGVDERLECGVQSTSRARTAVARQCETDIEDSSLLVVTVGRLVPRKGALWFVEQVYPLLPDGTHYIVAGDGPDYESIVRAAEPHADHVHVLGRVSDELRSLLYRACDVFVMPNRRVPGDMEGFGLVALEAGVNGAPVVAARIQGIRDAVLQGRTGLQVDPEDALAFVRAIQEVRTWDRDRIASLVREEFSWQGVYERYATLLGLDSASRDRPPGQSHM